MAHSNTYLLKLVYVVLVSVFVLLQGCAGSNQYGAVKITSSPAGAEIVNLKDDSNLGTTPAKVSFSGSSGTAEFVTIQLRKKGYADRITSFWINRRHDSVALAKENAIDLHIDLDKEGSN